MGNENSQPASASTTPASEYQSMYSFGSRRRSSATSSQHSSPVEPPQPDLSHLTQQEIAQIKSVIDRANHLQEDEIHRVRRIEEDYTSYAAAIVRQSSLSEIENDGKNMCPICHKVELKVNSDGTRDEQNVCADCQKIICTDCGSYATSLSTKLQEWVCNMCRKRRKLVLSTGLWYHGKQPDPDSVLMKELESCEENMLASIDQPPDDDGLVEATKPSEKPNGRQKPARQKHVKRQESLPSKAKNGATSVENENEAYAKAPADSDEVVESSSSFSCQTAAGSSRLKGTAASSRSESECSDLISDVDWEEMSMSKYRSELTSPDEISATSSGEEENKQVRKKYRPKSLHISRSVSVTSSEEEAEERDWEQRKSTRKDFGGGKEAHRPSPSKDYYSLMELEFDESLHADNSNPYPEVRHQIQSEEHANETKGMKSPSPPCSPSWREGLESPPFSPRRRDSYPGKRRGLSSPTSPKDKRFQFTYVDLSPSSRHHSSEDLYVDTNANQTQMLKDEDLSPQKTSPLTPDELKKAFVAACGQATQSDWSRREQLKMTPRDHLLQGKHHDMIDTDIVDLASYAATIATNTANLTSLSVSPTNLSPNLDAQDMVSPESIASNDSTSPLSPNYYDNNQSAEEAEEVELADPSTKSIDYQGTKRQKVRPPSSDWSPVTDLSPIIDVSPSVEEAEQEEMLAQQQEELRKQLSREDDDNGESDEEEQAGGMKKTKTGEDYTVPSLRRYTRFEDISKIGDDVAEKIPTVSLSEMIADFEKSQKQADASLGGETTVASTPSTSSAPAAMTTTLPAARPFPDARATNSAPDPVVASEASARSPEKAGPGGVSPAKRIRATISTSSLSSFLDSANSEPSAGAPDKPALCSQAATTLVTATSTSMAAVEAASTMAPSKPDGMPDGVGASSTAPEPCAPGKGEPPALPPVAKSPSKGPADKVMASVAAALPEPVKEKPDPPPRVRRKLPEPTPEIIATQKPPKPPKPIRATGGNSHISSSSLRSSSGSLPPAEPTRAPPPAPTQPSRAVPPAPNTSGKVKLLAEAFETKTKANHDVKPVRVSHPRQESERKRAKEMKAKPTPLLIQHIECEEQLVSPQYKVLDSPLTPEATVIKREYSDSTSVSPSSSPDHEVYAYPSPVTPPDSDSSPPKPQSPSSPQKEVSGARVGKLSRAHQHMVNNGSKRTRGGPLSSQRMKTGSADSQRPKDAKKIRRKLPPIPTDEEPAVVPRSRTKSPASSPAVHRKPGAKSPKSVRQLDNGVTSQKEEGLDANGILARTTAAPTAGLSRATTAGSNSATKSNNGRNGKQPNGATGSTKHAFVSIDKTQPVSTTQINPVPMKTVADKTPDPGKPAEKISNGGKLSRIRLSKSRSLSDEFTQDENDKIIDSMVTIYGIPISTAMKSLKRRLQDELRRVTECRRQKIEELEEIRALELQIEELKLDSKLDAKAVQVPLNGHKSRSSRNGRGMITSASFDKSGGGSRSTPQILPRRSRHRRQSSDPMIAKFSPIKEDKDIEADFQARANEAGDEKYSKYSTDDSSQSGVSDSESTRSEPINARYKKIKPSAYAKMFYTGRAQSTERIVPDHGQFLTAGPLSSSQSDTFLAEGLLMRCKTPTYFSDDEEKRSKEEKRQILQYEIEKRKRQLEETARLQQELVRLQRTRQAVAHSYDDIPKRYAYSAGPCQLPTGIIKPLDDDPAQTDRYAANGEDAQKDSADGKRGHEIYQGQANYSSTEYLAHKQELARRQRYDDYPPYTYGESLGQSQAFPSSPNLINRSEAPACASAPAVTQGISSSVTLPEINRSDLDFIPTRDMHTYSDTDNSPNSDYTPAMPLLDDVTTRSRKIIHDIGNRPLSAEFNLPGGVDDLMNAMYRVESDNSVDADEPIMKHMTEGGVTILKQLERKKQPPPPQPKRYNFQTKRILLTRDPKDRSIKGNGIGMKIVGGKQTNTANEMVAYVAAIYAGGIAEQLHGELEEGDQILEWNGIELTGKTYEEVQQIISQLNGEIDLLVRPGTNLCPKETEGNSLQPASCHSSYDNLDYISDDDYDRCMENRHGIDPKQLAAELEGIQETTATTSPGDSPSSSQQEFLTPSMSSACSTPHSDLTTSSSDRQRHAVEKMITTQEDTNMGELQLQLSFDDYDNTLNVHVIQARNLLRADITGLSDPFVKAYLLPGRSPDHKRRTKYVSCTLNPEWHQTLVFQHIHREELKNKILEITVWDYDRFKPNDFLGQIVIDFADDYYLDNTAHWYPLSDQDESLSSTDLPKPTVLPPADRRSGTPSGFHRHVDGRKQGHKHHYGQTVTKDLGSDLLGIKMLGTLAEGDRLQAEKPAEVLSARSSPIPQYIQRDRSPSPSRTHGDRRMNHNPDSVNKVVFY